MAVIEKTWTIEAKGVGFPDYTREVHAAKERAGIGLGYGQTIKRFGLMFTPLPSIFSWVATPLASGASAHLVDAETGLAVPWTLPVGYTATLIQDAFELGEDVDVVVSVSVPPVPGIWPALMICQGMGGTGFYRNRVISFSTDTVDPTALTTHDIDIVVTNNGLGVTQGALEVILVITELGTQPLPTIKTVQCKHCGHQWEVPVNTSTLICPECGQFTIVYDLSSFRGTK